VKTRHTHGEAGVRSSQRTAEYRAWANIKNRCHNELTPAYAYYGARGIAVCDKWRNSYESFLADMGRRPSPSHSIDRIDNDRGYEPGNCRWATLSEQRRNTRAVQRFEHGGDKLMAIEWQEKTGLRSKIIRRRLIRGWSIEKAVTTPKLEPGEGHASQYVSNRNSSGFKGVSTSDKKNKPWRAVVRQDGRQSFVGYYATAEEAARAYDARAISIYGEHALLNFPEAVPA
jgi:hypothetical protein